MKSISLPHLALAAALVCSPAFTQTSPSEPAPPSRALMLELCREPRLAGTSGSRRAGEWTARQLRAAGWQVEIETRSVLLSLPRSSDLEAPGLFRRRTRFDPNASPAGDIPLFHAWAKSGSATGEVIFVGRGLRADFERLAAKGADFAGKVALAEYGGAYRGVKVAMAAEFGCSAALIFSPSSEDGPAHGPAWPAGPWKPAHDAQRGSILSLTEAPGDPSTPGFASRLLEGTPGDSESNRQPLSGAALEARMPQIPSLPLGSADASLLLSELEAGRAPQITITLDNRIERRAIHNVIARLLPESGPGGDFVMAGTHRDAWVRGAHDSGSGVVSLLRTAQHLGARFQAGWRPQNEIRLAFWDAEETGLFGSTEWAEAHAGDVTQNMLAYVNGDACVSGLDFHASGTPGLLGTLNAALKRLPATRPAQTEAGHEPSLYDAWSKNGERRLGLVGSGSDYTVFLHHFGIPVLDLGFGGNPGGQYHTAVDDFALMDRYLDPTWAGHEAAGKMFEAVLEEITNRGRASFDSKEAALDLARVFKTYGEQDPAIDLAPVVNAFERAADSKTNLPRFFARLALPNGLAERPWYTNALWAPGVETGYAAVLLPTLINHPQPAKAIADLAEHIKSSLISR